MEAVLHFCHTELVNWCQRLTATTVAYLLTFLIPVLQRSRVNYSLCLEEMEGLCWTDHIPAVFVGMCVLKGKYCFEAILCHSIPVAINFTVKEEVPHIGVFIFTPSLDTHCDSPVCAKFWYQPPVSHSSHWHWQKGGCIQRWSNTFISEFSPFIFQQMTCMISSVLFFLQVLAGSIR